LIIKIDGNGGVDSLEARQCSGQQCKRLHGCEGSIRERIKEWAEISRSVAVVVMLKLMMMIMMIENLKVVCQCNGQDQTKCQG
jgi:hypothetical protein